MEEWENIGLELGLLHPTLTTISKDNSGNTAACKRAMLASWLNKNDIVTKRGGPSWEQLATALRNYQKIPEAENIESTYLNTAKVSIP